MLKAINYVNGSWNRFVFWFHDISTRANVRWLVTLSIWMFDRLNWRLPDRYQLICGVPFEEYMLRHELELARHQSQYWADYAYELQLQILEDLASSEEADKDDQDEASPGKIRTDNKNKGSRHRSPQRARQA